MPRKGDHRALVPGLPAACALSTHRSLSPPGCLVDRKGKILIPGINEAVAPVTEEELKLYDQIDFDLEEYAKDVGAQTLLHGCKVLPWPRQDLSVPKPPNCRGPVGRSRGAGRDLGISVGT